MMKYSNANSSAEKSGGSGYEKGDIYPPERIRLIKSGL